MSRRDPPSSLARFVGREPPSEAELFALRRAAWRRQRIVTLRLDEVADEGLRRALAAEAERLYGRRR